jgi:2',3'-cyclic-nucleotide 2'-phosphodiesterase (5'-nucleotidase family)
MLKKLFLFLFFFGVIFCLRATELVILNTTDLHGHASGHKQGALRLASLIMEQKKLYPTDSMLLIDCGDTIQGTFSSVIFQGELMIKCLNYLQYDVWVLGNHEFDYKLAVLKKRMKEFSGNILAANLESPSLAGAYSSWKIFKKSGLKIAVIGLTKDDVSKTVLSKNKVFKTTPPFTALQRIMPEIRAANPDIIILAQHEGMYGKGFFIYKFISKFPEIDLVLGGHTHVNKPGQKVAANTWYFQAGKHGSGLGKIVIDYDKKQKKIIKISSEIIPVSAKTPVDKILLKQLSPSLAQAKKFGDEKIGKAVFKNCEKLDSSIIEQKIIGKMMLARTAADVAICNAYPSKYKLSGNVTLTRKRLYYWCRYNNTICTLLLDKVTYQKIIAEQKSAKKRNYNSIITYANKADFNKKSKILVAFNSYAIRGAGGKFPFLHKIAKSKNFMLKDDGVIIKDALSLYLKGKLLLVTNKSDGNINIQLKPLQ